MARNPQQAEKLASPGVQVRRADYSEPGSLGPTLAGVEKQLLVSISEVGQRTEQHRNVMEAARDAGVRLLAYTSILKAAVSPLQLAIEHRATRR